MTSREFRIWLEGFLTTMDLDKVQIRTDINPTYNHLTMLKTIHNKLKEVNDIQERENNINSNLLTETFKPTTPPNPFEIKCEVKK